MPSDSAGAASARADGATVLLPRPSAGRTFASSRRVRLSDTTPTGVLRLDALGRYIQDIATDDARETMTGRYLAWVVRRCVMEVTSAPTSEEMCELTTWCAGYGSRWAERRTSLVGSRGGRCESVVLWVAVDTKTGAPARLPDSFHDSYGEAHAGRKVSARLQHGSPPSHADPTEWQFREADMDRLGHVNNAAYWTIVEERYRSHERPSAFRAEVEYRDPTVAGAGLQILEYQPDMWVVDGSGDTKASFRVNEIETAAAESPTLRR
ncbi:MAG: acyl-[acyl-carrier-protein] thioesterase [Acidimicrobiales bacterium]